MAFNELEEKFLYCAKAIPPKFDEMKKLIEAGVNINALDDDETLLSSVILGYPDVDVGPCDSCAFKNGCGYNCDKFIEERAKVNGRYLPSVVKFILDNGYDVSLGEGMYGGCALYALAWSSCDKYIIEVAKILMDAGANPLWEAEGETVIELIGVKTAAALTLYNDAYEENVFETLYDVLVAKTEGRAYNDIFWYDEAYGKRICRVYSCAESTEKAVYDFETGGTTYENAFEKNIVFDCEGVQLQLNQWCNAKVDPNVPSIEKQVDLSHMFAPVVGKRIVKISPEIEMDENGKLARCVLRIIMDDGSGVEIRDNCGMQKFEKYCAHFIVHGAL